MEFLHNNEIVIPNLTEPYLCIIDLRLHVHTVEIESPVRHLLQRKVVGKYYFQLLPVEEGSELRSTLAPILRT